MSFVICGDYLLGPDGVTPIRDEDEPCTEDLHYHRMTVVGDDGTETEYLHDHDFRPPS